MLLPAPLILLMHWWFWYNVYAHELMLLIRRCCWCADAADTTGALMLLMHWCCWCADALILLMRWCCLWADAAASGMLLMHWIVLIQWFCWWTDTADKLMQWWCWCTDAADALMHSCCWCADAADTADALLLLMHWCCWWFKANWAPANWASADWTPAKREKKNTFCNSAPEGRTDTFWLTYIPQLFAEYIQYRTNIWCWCCWCADDADGSRPIGPLADLAANWACTFWCPGKLGLGRLDSSS